MSTEIRDLAFCHPLDGRPLEYREDGNLCDAEGSLAFTSNGGSFDFALGSEDERDFHEALYSTGGWWAAEGSLDALDLNQLWQQEPGCMEYLNSIGDVNGKRVLLLGNGTSIKEFLFVRRGAHVVFTDLSLRGVLYAKERFLASRLAVESPGVCEFHAVNAYALPFAESTFDVICADAVIHHLEDLPKLLGEIRRCLKPGGICRFLDTAYSSLWQRAKKTVLRPLQQRTHRESGISPEDQRATERGGYSRQELHQLIAEVGFRSLYYKRVALFDYLLWRARCKLHLHRLLAVRPAVRGFDRLLALTPIMEHQGIALVCGFDK